MTALGMALIAKKMTLKEVVAEASTLFPNESIPSKLYYAYSHPKGRIGKRSKLTNTLWYTSDKQLSDGKTVDDWVNLFKEHKIDVDILLIPVEGGADILWKPSDVRPRVCIDILRKVPTGEAQLQYMRELSSRSASKASWWRRVWALFS